MQIRRAAEVDWPRIIEIYNQAVDDGSTADTHPTTVADRAHWLQQHSDPRYPILLAVDSKHILGWCSLSPWRPGRQALNRVAEVSYYVDRDLRGHGIADRLMAAALDYALQHGFRYLLAILLDTNRPSLNLLRKHRFQRWGTLPGVADFGLTVCGQYIYGRSLDTTNAAKPRLAAIL